MAKPLQFMPPSHDRALPWDETAEVSVLGACLIDGDVMVEVAALLQPEHFHRDAHRRIYVAMQAVADRKEPIEPVTLQAELVSRGEFDQVGGWDFVAWLLDAVPTAANVMYHSRLVLEAARRRQLIKAGEEIVRNAYDPDGAPVSVLVDRAEQLVSNCAEVVSAEAVRVKAELMGVITQLEEAAANPGQLAGLSWGLDDLDAWTGGLHRGDLTVVAARPSMGKTAFVTGVLMNVGLSLQEPAAIFSLEMSKRQVTQRMLCYEALVDISKLLRGDLSDDDFGRIAHAAGHLNSAPLWIDDSGSLTVPELRAKVRRMIAVEPGLKLIVVDYIQLMSGGKRAENRTQEVSAISRGLKLVAKEFDVPIIALSQLSRAPEQRSSHRPQLSDLRESGSIEQDADLVAFLYRPEYYLSGAEAQEKEVVGKAELILGKQRNGPTGTVDLFFRKECARFEAMQETRRAANWGVTK